jgi:CsoR family transcriptional regulator, copper-sensing transcriptional repressor
MDCENPRHDEELAALARIEGQIRGISGMIVEGRYCVDILTQTRAVHAALRRVERNIMSTYLDNCVTHAFKEGSTAEREEKVREILALFDYDNGKSAR